MRPRFAEIMPKCCPNEETLTGWLIAADSRIIPKPKCGFCTDCLPDFQSRMKAEGRCENPSVRFVSNRYGFQGVLANG